MPLCLSKLSQSQSLVKLAERDVRKYGKNADVYVVDIDVAAFITPSHLKNIKFNGYDLVLVPGLTKDCDWESFERQRGVKIRLGPIHAYDLKTSMKRKRYVLKRKNKRNSRIDIQVLLAHFKAS